MTDRRVQIKPSATSQYAGKIAVVLEKRLAEKYYNYLLAVDGRRIGWFSEYEVVEVNGEDKTN